MLGANELRASITERLAEFRYDPYGYVLYAFPWSVPGTPLAQYEGPRQWQRESLERIGAGLKAGGEAGAIIREATCSGHGVGKSALVAWLTKWAQDTLIDSKVVVTANTDKQLATKTWPELSKWHHLSITRDRFVFTATSLYSAIPEHEKTWRADAIPWSEHNTEAFAGLHNLHRRIVLIFDEASKIADKVWEVAEGALTDEGTEIVWAVFGNGTRATGRFRECFRKYRHRWHGESIDSRTVEGTNKALFDAWVTDYGEDSDFVKVRVRGMFPSASLKSFISESDVSAAYSRHLRSNQYGFAPKILSCDPAWQGDDMLVIGLRQGLAFFLLLALPKNDDDIWVAQKLAEFEDLYNVDAVFIDGGFGTGIVSAGKAMGRSWQIVWFSGKVIDEGYLNKRAEMWGNMKQWLKDGGSIPPHDQLRDDLIGPEIVPRTDGKIQLESKEDMKKRGIPSPNFGDCLALTFAQPVVAKKNDPTGTRPARGRTKDSWEPYGEGR